MTKEEAIAILRTIGCELGDQIDSAYCRKRYNAMKIAIKTLEQEPSEDAISRQDSIEAFSDMREGYPLTHDNPITDTMAVKILSSLPPVTPTRQTCKDCKWKSRNIDFRNLKCPWGERVEMTDNDFCSRYERR